MEDAFLVKGYDVTSGTRTNVPQGGSEHFKVNVVIKLTNLFFFIIQ